MTLDTLSGLGVEARLWLAPSLPSPGASPLPLQMVADEQPALRRELADFERRAAIHGEQSPLAGLVYNT